MNVTLEEIEEQYIEKSAKLLELIERREGLIKILKQVSPTKTTEVRNLIADCDRLIEHTEQILELSKKQKEQLLVLQESENRLVQMTERIKPEFLKYVAENYPEKLDEMEELFTEEISEESH
ncbi:MAG: hypothetical protein K1X72_21485 [Pyrinomonadaceae bacterium]|nr:hypothetical protein [Pyrinomonadaceae bacterium]